MSSPKQEAPIAFTDGYAEIETVATKKGHQILHPMRVDFPEGSVCAILGPSGGGKTTFLNILTDSIPSNIKARGAGEMYA